MTYTEGEIETLAKALNTVVGAATDAEKIELDFVIAHWNDIESVSEQTISSLKHMDIINDKARATAEHAVQQGSLHSNLLEHAVLLVEFEVMKYERVYSDKSEKCNAGRGTNT
jgi:hypothetical protein